MIFFSWQRLVAIVQKEFIHMRRDRVTIGMLVITPLIQLLLFGYAINLTPRHLPTVVVSQDHSDLTRQFIVGLQNSKYFKLIYPNASEEKAEHLLRLGNTLFVLNIPANFTRDLIAARRPSLLLTVDATDPASVGSATAAMQQLMAHIFDLQFQRGLSYLKPQAPAYQLIIHNQYNPEGITQYNIVPGLMGVIITMSSIMITALAITRERELGTIESLLATPVCSLEVMIGKIMPYILVGYCQQAIIWLVAQLLFQVPSQGSWLLLIVATLPFIAANLTVGLTFSTLANNQLQAVQMTFFFFLPSILLSGFMFPFYGMPTWARWLSQILPLTHFNRIVRGIMLKHAGLVDIWPEIWPMLLFMLGSGLICFLRYRHTLD